MEAPLIETFEQVIEQMVSAGVADNADFNDVDHPGIVGDMYEGLTREIMEAALLKDLDVRVRKGKIRFDSGAYSDQIDCMLVVGEGERIGHSDHYAYRLNNVIAVVEVKKTLTLPRLRDALLGFKRIVDARMRQSFGDEVAGAATRMQRDAFRASFKKPPPKDEGALLGSSHSQADNLMYLTIRLSASLPLFVIWGHGGYASEMDSGRPCLEQ